jgi:hypothetical protein
LAALPGFDRRTKRLDLTDKAIDFGARGRSGSRRRRITL